MMVAVYDENVDKMLQDAVEKRKSRRWKASVSLRTRPAKKEKEIKSKKRNYKN